RRREAAPPRRGPSALRPDDVVEDVNGAPGPPARTRRERHAVHVDDAGQQLDLDLASRAERLSGIHDQRAALLVVVGAGRELVGRDLGRPHVADANAALEALLVHVLAELDHEAGILGDGFSLEGQDEDDGRRLLLADEDLARGQDAPARRGRSERDLAGLDVEGAPAGRGAAEDLDPPLGVPRRLWNGPEPTPHRRRPRPCRSLGVHAPHRSSCLSYWPPLLCVLPGSPRNTLFPRTIPTTPTTSPPPPPGLAPRPRRETRRPSPAPGSPSLGLAISQK